MLRSVSIQGGIRLPVRDEQSPEPRRRPHRISDNEWEARAHSDPRWRAAAIHHLERTAEQHSQEYLLGHPGQLLAAAMRGAFEKEFYRTDRQQYDNGTQTSSILPLMFGITPEQNRAAVFNGLVRKIQSESVNHVDTGLVGAQWLMHADDVWRHRQQLEP
jgi:hypothetical protein